MSESAVETPEGTEDQEPTTTGVDWKAEARKHEKAAKDLRAQLRSAEPDLRALAELRAAAQTESERQASALSEATKRAEAAERTALRASVALKKGLSASLAARLQGDDEASLEADADELLSLVPQDSTPRAPRMDLSQGSSAAGAKGNDPGTQFAAILKQQMGR